MILNLSSREIVVLILVSPWKDDFYGAQRTRWYKGLQEERTILSDSSLWLWTYYHISRPETYLVINSLIFFHFYSLGITFSLNYLWSHRELVRYNHKMITLCRIWVLFLAAKIQADNARNSGGREMNIHSLGWHKHILRPKPPRLHYQFSILCGFSESLKAVSL